MNETTIRYKANQDCKFDCFNINNKDNYQYGCEFEFYIDISKYKFETAIEEIKNEIFIFSDVDILLDLSSIPTNKDKNHCIQIKPDQSLEDNGIEISIPITSKDGIKYYIKKIFSIINKYGYTNQDTGLHFHISTKKVDGVNFDFYTYMLACHDKNLLSSWQIRVNYSQNVMDILLNNSKVNARSIKSKKGTIWNLEKISANHIEIKSIGGLDYHKKNSQIIKEFDLYSEYFYIIHKNIKPLYRKKLIEEHKKIVASAKEETISKFALAVEESGLVQMKNNNRST